MEHLHARILKTSRPADVGSLIEAGLQFHYHSDFFAGRGLAHRLHNRRLFARAVQSLPHRDHIGIFRPGLDESDNSIE